MPIPFQVENVIASSFTPHGVIKSNNNSFRFFCRYLWEKILSVFVFQLPPTFGKELFLNTLFGNGVVTVVNSAEFGLLAQWGNAGGYNVNYQPRYMLFANPLLPEFSGRELEIGTDCAVIRLTDDWNGVFDLIAFYAGKMALATQAVDINLINSKLAYVFAAKDKTQKKKKKKLMDTIIGIPNANTEKRERLISDEVNANNVETSILAAGWLENIRDGCKMVADMYGATITVDWRYKPNVPNSNAKQSDNVRSGNV